FPEVIYQKIYELIQKSGFILVFREHNQSMVGKKKGNVDTDIVFTILSKIIDNEKFDKIILTSGDGDYFKMVKYLINKDRFCKLLAPNRHSTSSLYRVFTPKFVDFLDNPGIRNKIELKKS
ncbi:NYN domain-containing protein, partial [Candidatus Saccharibacteria bacterium]|nr:NYN domain-containing protein [Candidatus Saccharibacteria bacterium]